MGRIGLINRGGESKGAGDLADAVTTAVINKRAGGTGLISGRKAFQRPMAEGVELLNAIQDVYLDDGITDRLTRRAGRHSHDARDIRRGADGTRERQVSRTLPRRIVRAATRLPDQGGSIVTDTARTSHAHARAIDRVIIRFAGDSGDGMQLTGDRFTSVSALFGNDLATLPEFPAEIRAPAGTLAGVSAFQVHISDHDITTPGDAPNVLVAMNPAALQAPSSARSSRAARSSSTPTPSTSATWPRPATTPTRSTTAASRATRSTRCR